MTETEIRAMDAKALLANPVFKGFQKAMRDDMERLMLTADITDKDRCAALIQGMKMLKKMEQSIQAYIVDNQILEFVELNKPSIAKRMFKR